jgi:hypothetical protein
VKQLKRRARTSAVAGLVAVTIATGSSLASAQPARPLAWTRTPIKSGPAMLNDLDAQPAGTWAVGNDLSGGPEDQRPLLLRWDGSKWKTTAQPMQTNSSVESVAVAGAKDVWAVGEDRTDPSQPKPLVLRWNGSAWKVVPGPDVPAGSFDEVKIAPDGTPWVTGWARIGDKEPAVVYRYAGGEWRPLNNGLEGSINGNALAVISSTDAWLGLNAGMAHFDGKSWKLVDEVPSNGSQIPSALTAAGPKDVWAVGVEHRGGVEGETPLALHYDGVSWKRVAAPSGTAQLYDVVLRNKQPIAVGESLLISENTVTSKPLVLDYQGGKFVKAKSPTTADGTLTTADVANGKLWVGGLLSSGDFAPFAAYSN